MATVQKTPASKGFSLSKWIRGQLRPLVGLWGELLSIAGIVYVLGYLIWSINALVENLGLLPALEFQYFTAGVFPAFLIWLVYIGMRKGRQITQNLATWLGPNAKGGLVFLRRLVRFVFWGVSCSIAFWGTFWRLIGIKIDVFAVVLLAQLIVMLVTVPLYRMTIKRQLRPGLELFMWCYVLSGWCVIGLLFYLFVAYPKLPQSLGGLRPRCVYLDVKKTELSKETLEDIFLINTTTANREVIRSVELDFFFSSGDFIWVRRRVGKQDAKPRVYKIRKNIVQAVVSCK